MTSEAVALAVSLLPPKAKLFWPPVKDDQGTEVIVCALDDPHEVDGVLKRTAWAFPNREGIVRFCLNRALEHSKRMKLKYGR